MKHGARNGRRDGLLELPSEEDYAYTEVTDAGFTAGQGDTLAVDLSAELGGTYTYTAVHYDVNGNASNPASSSWPWLRIDIIA